MDKTFKELNQEYSIWLEATMQAIRYEFERNNGHRNNLVLSGYMEKLGSCYTSPNMYCLKQESDTIRCSNDTHGKDYSLYILTAEELLGVLYGLENGKYIYQ